MLKAPENRGFCLLKTLINHTAKNYLLLAEAPPITRA
jgi:hypothetical protein